MMISTEAVAEPKALLILHEYVAASAADTLVSDIEAVVWDKTVAPFDHWYVNGAVPSAVAVSVAFLPCDTGT